MGNFEKYALESINLEKSMRKFEKNAGFENNFDFFVRCGENKNFYI